MHKESLVWMLRPPLITRPPLHHAGSRQEAELGEVERVVVVADLCELQQHAAVDDAVVELPLGQLEVFDARRDIRVAREVERVAARACIPVRRPVVQHRKPRLEVLRQLLALRLLQHLRQPVLAGAADGRRATTAAASLAWRQHRDAHRTRPALHLCCRRLEVHDEVLLKAVLRLRAAPAHYGATRCSRLGPQDVLRAYQVGLELCDAASCGTRGVVAVLADHVARRLGLDSLACSQQEAAVVLQAHDKKRLAANVWLGTPHEAPHERAPVGGARRGT
eukprot:361323-Chlamydomonas_euryale.AAC.11